jgi:hypothetical protein
MEGRIGVTGRREEEGGGVYRDCPKAVMIDKGAEHRELGEALQEKSA